MQSCGGLSSTITAKPTIAVGADAAAISKHANADDGTTTTTTTGSGDGVYEQKLTSSTTREAVRNKEDITAAEIPRVGIALTI